MFVAAEMTSRRQQQSLSPGGLPLTYTSAPLCDDAVDIQHPSLAPSSIASPGPGERGATDASSPAGASATAPKLLPLAMNSAAAADEDNSKNAAAAAAPRLPVHSWPHGRKRRASGDSHEVTGENISPTSVL